MQTLISALIILAAAALVFFKFKDSLGDVSEFLEDALDFARGSALGMAAAGVLALFLLWLGFEAFFLAGPRVYDGQLLVGQPFPFTVLEPGETWVFTVGPTGNRKKELAWRVLGPDGTPVLAGMDGFRKSVRRFDFTSLAAGEHALVVDYALPGNYTRLGWLRVNRDDRSFLLRRFGHLWPIKLGVWSPFHPRDPIPGHQIDWNQVREGLE